MKGGKRETNTGKSNKYLETETRYFRSGITNQDIGNVSIAIIWIASTHATMRRVAQMKNRFFYVFYYRQLFRYTARLNGTPIESSGCPNTSENTNQVYCLGNLHNHRMRFGLKERLV